MFDSYIKTYVFKTYTVVFLRYRTVVRGTQPRPAFSPACMPHLPLFSPLFIPTEEASSTSARIAVYVVVLECHCCHLRLHARQKRYVSLRLPAAVSVPFANGGSLVGCIPIPIQH
jgi:hypothetical protein